jgi:hypothetical protein
MTHRTPYVPFAAAGAIAFAALAPAQPQESARPADAAPAAPVTFDALAAKFASTSPELITLTPIGRSRQQRPIHALRLAADGPIDPDERPALLIIAGLDGQRLVGPRTALGVAQSLVANHADVLDDCTVYVVPAVNHDCLALHALAVGPKRDFSWTLTPDDADRDGRSDEDGPADLNGDGAITFMRVLNPPPGVAATHMIDPGDERLLKKPDAALGETANYALFVEGLDADGDGDIAEDGQGGVDLDMNFMHLYPEHTPGAGAYQLCESESLALVNWMLQRDNIVGVLVFGPHDTLVKVPDSAATDESGQAPKGILEGDKKHYEAVSKAFKEITKMKEAPERDSAGAFHAWAYAQFGSWSFSTPVWVRPDQIEGGEPDEEKKEDAAAPAAAEEAKPKNPLEGLLPEGWPTDPAALRAQFEGASDAERTALITQFRTLPPAVQGQVMQAFRGMAEQEQAKKKGGGAATDPDAGKWLKYIEKHRGGEGFIAWAPFDHPTLGKVEIGGFVPGVKVAPPDADMDRLIDEQTKFALELVRRLPRLAVDAPIVEPLGPGLSRVTLRVRNTGVLPTASAMADRAKRIPPIVVRLDVPGETILAGPRVARINTIDGGAYAELEWTIAAAPGATIQANVTSAALGDSTIDIAIPN